MQEQLCPRLLNEVIAIKRSLSMHIRFVRRAHAVRQTDSVVFLPFMLFPLGPQRAMYLQAYIAVYSTVMVANTCTNCIRF